ncbi:hypothetical protein QIU18_12440 [Capnocytophaga canimorsus]|nr:hypothetical protein [Capnocytophaga canimorsus]WGU70261.1 hypothetical protein QIU18_12440 [Capnocytophaga canimorsus]
MVIVALVLIGFNITYIDLDNPFSGNSMVAIIAIVAALCALMLASIALCFQKNQRQAEINNFLAELYFLPLLGD